MRPLLALAFLAVAGLALGNESDDERNDDRIVGGVVAPNHARPWQVLLRSSTGGFCGGTLVDQQWVLTAAHCLPTTSGASLYVVMGTNSWCTTMGTTQYGDGYLVKNVIQVVSNNYNPTTIANDIALLKLDSPVTLNSNIQLVQAPTVAPVAGEMLEVSGWGSLSEGGSLSCNLMTVSVPVVQDSICQSTYGSKYYTGNFCAGPLAGGKDSCQGDSGGPLVKLTSNGAILYGVVSFGVGCAKPNYPGVYTKVLSFLPWIQGVIGGTATPPTTTTTTTVAPPTGGGTVPAQFALCKSVHKQYIGDGYCDDTNNSYECLYDGADCCANPKAGWNAYCTECACKHLI